MVNLQLFTKEKQQPVELNPLPAAPATAACRLPLSCLLQFTDGLMRGHCDLLLADEPDATGQT